MLIYKLEGASIESPLNTVRINTFSAQAIGRSFPVPVPVMPRIDNGARCACNDWLGSGASIVAILQTFGSKTILIWTALLLGRRILVTGNSSMNPHEVSRMVISLPLLCGSAGCPTRGKRDGQYPQQYAPPRLPLQHISRAHDTHHARF